MNWISQSFNISNIICSRSQLFDHRDVLKKLRNIHKKNTSSDGILIKLQASNRQSETLIKKSTPAQIFSQESCKNIKNTIFAKQLRVTASVFITLLKYSFRFIMHFSTAFIIFKRVTQS